MIYYYFVNNREIGEFITPMEGSSFRELTPEQLAFHNEHPAATVWEVMACELNEPYVAPQPTLAEVKEDAIRAVDRKSRETIGMHVDTLALADAMTSLIFAQSNSVPAIYDTTTSNETIESFLTIGKACRDKYHEAVESINACETCEEVGNVLSLTISYYDAL